MKSLFGVLSLVIVLVYSQDLEPPACDKTLGPEELHQVDGDWGLVSMTFDPVRSAGRLIPMMNSSHVEVRVQSDHSIVVQEHNTVQGKCVFYNFTLTRLQDSDTHGLDMHRTVMFVDGEKTTIDDRATIEFLPGPANTLNVVFKGQNHEDLLAMFRRDGHQGEDLQQHRAMAKCLGLSGENFTEWLYDGHSDFCHKTSAQPTPVSELLQQVGGDWVVMMLTFDKVKSEGRRIPQQTSAHIEVKVLLEKQRISVHERNMVGGHCASFPFNLPLPQSNATSRRFEAHRTVWYLDGQQIPINEKATLQVFPVSANTMRTLYRGEDGENFLLTLRREGHHREDLGQDREGHRALANSLGLSGGDMGEWFYDGVSDFCHR